MNQNNQKQPILSVENLMIAYGETPIVEGLHLQVEAGEIVGIVGESGSGKTSIGLSILGLCEGRVEGKISFKGENLLDIPRETLRSLRGDRIAIAFQDMAALHPSYSALYQVAEVISAHRVKKNRSAFGEAGKWLRIIGLPEEKIEAFPHQLSGGERQLVMIAIATANQPDLLILDEPVSFQDEHAKMRLVQWFQTALKKTSILLITHDVSVATRMASRLLVLCGGKIVEEGKTKVLINKPLHPYTRALFRSNVSLNPHRELVRIPGDPTEINRQGCPFQPRCVQAVQQCRFIAPELKEVDGRRIACHRGGVVALLKADSISKTFVLKGKRIRALENVTISIHSGEGVALMGPTGAGKSTLGALLSGLQKPDKGVISSDFGKDRFHHMVQMVHQNPKEAISPRFTVEQTVEEPLRIMGDPRPFDARVKKVLREVGLPTSDDFLRRLAHTLSGGELKRLILARALIANPLIIIADEPTAGVDASFASQILRLLMTLQETRGLSLLMITHDPYVAQKVADRILYLEGGQIKKITPSLTPVSHKHPAALLQKMEV